MIDRAHRISAPGSLLQAAAAADGFYRDSDGKIPIAVRLSTNTGTARVTVSWTRAAGPGPYSASRTLDVVPFGKTLLYLPGSSFKIECELMSSSSVQLSYEVVYNLPSIEATDLYLFQVITAAGGAVVTPDGAAELAVDGAVTGTWTVNTTAGAVPFTSVYPGTGLQYHPVLGHTLAVSADTLVIWRITI